MTTVEETQLPGVGVRRDFVTGAGERIGVIEYRSGRRELLVYDHRDPDSCRNVVRLDDSDSRTLAELLGPSRVTDGGHPEAIAGAGFTIDWTTVSIASACAGRTLAQATEPAGSAASIAAIVRHGEVIATPAPDFKLEAGDTAVLIGSPEGIRELTAALQRG